MSIRERKLVGEVRRQYLHLTSEVPVAVQNTGTEAASNARVADERLQLEVAEAVSQSHGFTIHRSIYAELEDSLEDDDDYEDDQYFMSQQSAIPIDAASQKLQLAALQDVDMDPRNVEVGTPSQLVLTRQTCSESQAKTGSCADQPCRPSENGATLVTVWQFDASNALNGIKMVGTEINTPTSSNDAKISPDNGKGFEIIEVHTPNSPLRKVSDWIGSLNGTQVNVSANKRCLLYAFFASTINVPEHSFKPSDAQIMELNGIKQQATDIILANLRYDVQLKLVEPHVQIARLYPHVVAPATTLAAKAAL